MSDSSFIAERYQQELSEKKKKSDLIKRELERRSHDEIKVHNPTTKDWYQKYGQLYWEVPNKNKNNGEGKGNAVVPRYVARNYVKAMLNHILGLKVLEAVKKAREIYRGEYFAGEEEKIGMRIRKNKKLIDGTVRKLWLGLHKRYGLDDIPTAIQAQPQVEKRLDTIEGIIDRIETGEPALDTVEKPPESLIKRGKKEPQLKKQSNEEFAKELE